MVKTFKPLEFNNDVVLCEELANAENDDEQSKQKEQEYDELPTDPEYWKPLTIQQILERHPLPGWKKVEHAARGDIRRISNKLIEDEEENGPFFPRKEHIFAALRALRPEEVVLLIVGQDPYHNRKGDGKPAANGHAFATWPGAKLQPSLVNIFKEVKNCYPEFDIPKSGDLTGWVEQGILLLNTSLTVRPGVPDSHKENWMGFTSKVIKHLVELHGKKLVVFLWGGKAKKLVGDLVASATVFETSHPSPFSVDRGFNGCQHFKLANEYFKKNKMREIDWTNV